MSSPRSADADTTFPPSNSSRMPSSSWPLYTAGYSENVITPLAELSTGAKKNSPPGMFLRPSSTSPWRPSSEIVRSVPSPTMRISAAVVETVGVAAHPLTLRVPVEQARAEDDLRELVERQAGLLGERVRRVLAADPRDLGRHRAAVEDLLGRVARARAARAGGPPPRACSRARRASCARPCGRTRSGRSRVARRAGARAPRPPSRRPSARATS